jgi:hypothetical protein
VSQLLAQALPRRHVLTLRRGDGAPAQDELNTILAGTGSVSRAADHAEAYLLVLADGIVLGQALARLSAAGIDVLACRGERSEVEEAFLLLTEEPEG